MATPRFRAVLRRLAQQNMSPLWEVMRTVTPEPVTPVKAAHWRYEDVRPLLFEAVMISAEEAERRVLVLENPGLPNMASITHSLYAGIQLVLPGEVAPQHRHSQAALRFVLEGKGATTTVNGERLEMYPGDLVLTPSFQWHDHQNETDEPIVWMDGLDIALVGLLDASFAQVSNQREQEVTQAKGTSRARYGGNLPPIDDGPASPNRRWCAIRTRGKSRSNICARTRLGSVSRRPLALCPPADRRLADADDGASDPARPGGFPRHRIARPTARSMRSPRAAAPRVIGDATFATQKDVFVAPPRGANSSRRRLVVQARPSRQRARLWRRNGRRGVICLKRAP